MMERPFVLLYLLPHFFLFYLEVIVKDMSLKSMEQVLQSFVYLKLFVIKLPNHFLKFLK